MIRTCLTLMIVAMAIATTALAGSVATSPKALVLQKSDLPPGARLVRQFGDTSGPAAGYYATYRYTSGSKPRQLSSFASVWQSANAAAAGFRQSKADVSRTAARLALPKFGDEQLAIYQGGDGARLLVRKGNVFWLLELAYDNDAGLTKAEATAELRRYGPKAMRRAGAGG